MYVHTCFFLRLLSPFLSPRSRAFSQSAVHCIRLQVSNIWEEKRGGEVVKGRGVVGRSRAERKFSFGQTAGVERREGLEEERGRKEER